MLHYTAIDWQTTIDAFTKGENQVSAHYLIGKDGKIAEFVPAFTQRVKAGTAPLKTNLISHQKAWHAGESSYVDAEQRTWYNLNDYALGIELENWNGNVFSYSEETYKSLSWLLKGLIKRYPSLAKKSRIMGHQDIAELRGKVDPGVCFDWRRLYNDLALPFEQKKRGILNEQESPPVAHWLRSLDLKSSISSYWGKQSTELERIWREIKQQD